MNLAERVLDGDEKSAARIISLIERGNKEAYRELTKLLPHTHQTHVIGVTGPAGAGKSTLIGRLALPLCHDGTGVGIVAIDPTSIRSHGALLADRVRMRESEMGGKAFIRSMADRDHPGGVCPAAAGAVSVIAALGKRRIFIESVGAGQSDKAIFYLADTVVTVFTPEFGDEIQLLKAGLLEIGDIILVNKGDKANAEDALLAISKHVVQKGETTWKTPVLLVQAHTGQGIEELLTVIKAREEFLQQDGQGTRSRKDKSIIFMMALLKEEVWSRLASHFPKDVNISRIFEEVGSDRLDLYSAVDLIAQDIEMKMLSGHQGET